MNSSCVYHGNVFHSRHVVSSCKASNSFKYPVMYLYLDLSDLNNTFKHIPFVSINEYNLISWFRSHYIGDSNILLSQYVKDLILSHCNRRPDGKVCLLTLPTQFGYGFNPVSIFYCFDASNTKIQAIVVEVHNTPWLETHCYILPFFECDSNDNKLMTAQWKKAFHVSPFYAMQYEYVWSFSNPNGHKHAFKSFGCLIQRKNESSERLDIKKHEWGTSSLASAVSLEKNAIDWNEYEKVFDFGFRDMKRMEINNRNMLLFLMYFPVISCAIQLWIYWQALKVYWKGIEVQQHPKNKYVNPFVFWIKHSLMFLVAIISNITSFITRIIAKIFTR